MHRPINMTLAPWAGLALAIASAFFSCPSAATENTPLPAPVVNGPANVGRDQTAYLAGGCFWGVEGVFEHVKGVKQATSGYVADGVETVKIVFDPSIVSYGQLLQIFFSVAHDPTQLNRQGPDVGPEYRSEIFTSDAAQKQVANAYLAQLAGAKAFSAPIVTRVESVRGFKRADDSHQGYMRRHPRDPYIVYNDLPKLAQLKSVFPALYVE
jgi:peptide-methionine (S)-S-oxide reductase